MTFSFKASISTLSKNKFFGTFLFALAYGVVFYSLHFFFAETGFLKSMPESKTIMYGDAGFYNTIRQYWYFKDPNANGFFILFPLVWKLSCLNVWGITALNLIFFSLGFGFLMKTIEEEDKLFWLLMLTLPATFYAFLPLTEALFFLLGSLALYAVKNEKKGILLVTIFLIALVRATTIFLLPALFVMELLSAPMKDWRKSIKSFIKMAIPSVLGLALFICFQYLQTGVWFVYFKVQAEHWEKRLSIPQFPLTNLENGYWRYQWLSALALLIGITSAGFVIQKIVLWLKQQPFKDKNALFSSVFLAMVFIFVFFCNPAYDHHTSVAGANRYTLITPFCFYMLHYWYKQSYSQKFILFYIVFANAFFALFNAMFDKTHYSVIGLFPTLLICAFMVYAYGGRQKHWILFAIIAFNFLAQMLFFQEFLQMAFLD